MGDSLTVGRSARTLRSRHLTAIGSRRFGSCSVAEGVFQRRPRDHGLGVARRAVDRAARARRPPARRTRRRRAGCRSRRGARRPQASSAIGRPAREREHVDRHADRLDDGRDLVEVGQAGRVDARRRRRRGRRRRRAIVSSRSSTPRMWFSARPVSTSGSARRVRRLGRDGDALGREADVVDRPAAGS